MLSCIFTFLTIAQCDGDNDNMKDQNAVKGAKFIKTHKSSIT